jgi:hypothetical protein
MIGGRAGWSDVEPQAQETGHAAAYTISSIWTYIIDLDLHKSTIAVAVTVAGENRKAASYGTIANTTTAPEKLVERLRAAGGVCQFCYEAAPAAMASTAR